jgi:hypothetical protein
MARNTKLLAAFLVLGIAATAQAQWGFSIGGGGGGFSIGRGGGYYGPGYYGPGYGPGYYGRSGVGVRVGNLGYYDYDDYYGDRYYYVRPRARTYYVLPDNAVAPSQGLLLPSNKVASARPVIKDGDILLRSPADAPGQVGYGINDQWIYMMKPGQKQTLAAGSHWTIEFNRGIDGTEPARYELEPGIYEFSYSEVTGWDLNREGGPDLPPPPEAPPVADEAGNDAGSDETADGNSPSESATDELTAERLLEDR